MNENRRIRRELTPEEKERIARYRQQIAAELPDLIARDQLRKEASQEPTLSGDLRRAIHSSDVPLTKIAEQTGITNIQLDEFLTGERTLRSDVLDRLAAAIGYRLHAAS
jgi:hypothetical protein